MKTLQHKFVDHIPDDVDNDILYISIPYDTIIHKCCCGCGNEVVTPLSPTQWSFTYDGETITIKPSIGNWSFNCQSHYFIEENKILWSRKYKDHEIEYARKTDLADNTIYFQKNEINQSKSIVSRLKSFWKSVFPNKKLSFLRGKLTKQSEEEIDEQTSALRSEWNRNI